MERNVFSGVDSFKSILNKKIKESERESNLIDISSKEDKYSPKAIHDCFQGLGVSFISYREIKPINGDSKYVRFKGLEEKELIDFSV